jgi:mRNA deadenylase 3'-5' endonuclease subunit Ccr4
LLTKAARMRTANAFMLGINARLQHIGQPAPTLTVSTFNIWCPLFRRMHDEDASREAAHRELYMERNRKIIQLIDTLDSDVVCLQEFWVDNMDFVDLYKTAFSRRLVLF